MDARSAGAQPTDGSEGVHGLEGLVCPQTKRPLALVLLAEAEARLGSRLSARTGGAVAAVGATPTVLLRDDHLCAYPVVDGTAVLLAPERLIGTGGRLGDPAEDRYAEAYEEMAFYNEAAERETLEETARRLTRAVALAAARGSNGPLFPHPRRAWVDATFEPAAQWDAFRHLAPIMGESVVQLGGKGIQAVKFLQAGAAFAWLVTPMLGEIRYAQRLADQVGVGHRLRGVVAVAEELPLPDESVDCIYAGATAHHMTTELAFRECARVLRPGGRFAAVEPWKAPLYELGIAVLGKRENVSCRPMTAARCAPLADAFPSSRIVHHGALSRYPLLALSKLGLPIPIALVAGVTVVDDALSSIVPLIRRSGSSTALLASKGSE